MIQACPLPQHPVSKQQLCHGLGGILKKGATQHSRNPKLLKAGIKDSSLLSMWYYLSKSKITMQSPVHPTQVARVLKFSGNIEAEVQNFEKMGWKRLKAYFMRGVSKEPLKVGCTDTTPESELCSILRFRDSEGDTKMVWDFYNTSSSQGAMHQK